MQQLKLLSLTLALAAAPLAGQSQTRVVPWVSAGGGWSLNIAQDRSYTSSVAHVEHLTFGWRFRGRYLSIESVFAQSTYGDADTCDLLTRPCPQIYSLVGSSILFPAERADANGIPPRIAYAAGPGIYWVRTPKTGNRFAPALQGDLDLALIREERGDLLLGLKLIAMPKVRGDFLVATPFTFGLRLW